MKFTDRGEVRLEVSAVGPGVRFAVIDTGPGIAGEDFGRLFQEFTQLDARPTRKFGGSGLGLALSRRMARLIGGDVTLASEVGRGSTFILELPLEAPRVNVTTSPAMPAVDDGSGGARSGGGAVRIGGGAG